MRGGSATLLIALTGTVVALGAHTVRTVSLARRRTAGHGAANTYEPRGIPGPIHGRPHSSGAGGPRCRVGTEEVEALAGGARPVGG
ncbi:hypothetical protein GCM10022244_13830 [Streptomyces gulbargensis]|uniref:Secreted protein n=1 Tax=Streptomyces gulbargensis TaxID=364901 RepID=A0ABP7LMQ2_9ACTN